MIDIKGIPDEGFVLNDNFDPQHFDLEKVHESRFNGDIEAAIELSRVGSNYSIKVNLKVPMISECVKCLAEFEHVEEIEFLISGQANAQGTIHDDYSDAIYEEGFSVKPARRKNPGGLVGSNVNLAPAIRQEILMNINEYPHCHDDCAGLCSKCGANLNLGPCECDNN